MKNFIRLFSLWLPLAAFFFLQFMLRVSPNVMADDILRHFEINATNFGLLMSVYYMGYAGMQIPIGLLLDLWGPRYVAMSGSLICASGALLFAYTDHWHLGLLGRLLIGMGSSAAFISASKAIRLWFPEKNFSLFMACTVTIGLLGAFSSGKPTAHWVELYGWQQTLTYMGLATFVVSLLIYGFVRSSAEQEPVKQEILNKGFLRNFFTLIIQKKILWIGVLGALLTGPLCVFADVWGVSYFVYMYGLPKAQAAEACATIYIGMAAGGPVLAILFRNMNNYHYVIAASGLIMASILICVLNMIVPYSILLVLMFIMGVFCAYQILMFSLVLGVIPKQMSGLTIGCVNTINMLSGLCYLPLVGFLMDYCWDGNLINGLRYYSEMSYKMAFSTVVISLIIGSFGFVLLKLIPKEYKTK